MAVRQVLPLELLRPGEQGRLCDVDGRPELVCRLHEMGFQNGVLIRMVQPGTPCIVALDDHRISFRGNEAAMMLVEVGE